MIELTPTENDDIGFLALAQRIMNGAIVELRIREVFLVHVDNWFDHKWLGWGSWKGKEELRIPKFTPNRIRSEKHFVWSADTSAWERIGLKKALHIWRPGRAIAPPLERFAESAAFVWYSGNTAINKVGCLMLYLSGADDYLWYASLRKGDEWTIGDEFRITRHELLVFEERGRQMELAHP